MTKMGREETKREIWRLWGKWPDRKQHDSVQAAAPGFHGHLESSGTGILGYGNFPSGDKYQTIRRWLEEYERLNLDNNQFQKHPT